MRVSELKKLGPQPEKFKDQVSFFIDLEGKAQHILDLGAKGEHLGCLAYGLDVFNTIYNLLPVSKHIKLLAVRWDKYSRMKLENTRKKLMKAWHGTRRMLSLIMR